MRKDCQCLMTAGPDNAFDPMKKPAFAAGFGLLETGLLCGFGGFCGLLSANPHAVEGPPHKED
jgi:hypothetical protein